MRFALFVSVAFSAVEARRNEKSSRTFAHPGVLIGSNQLAYVRAQSKVAGTPANVTLAKAIKNTWMNHRNQSSQPADWNGTISCGFFDSHDYGCQEESADASAVLINAMIWAVTGDPMWAMRAIPILDYYAQNLREYADWGNGKLEAGWAADKWARAAEMLTATGAPWPKKDADAFRTMLATISVPAIYNGSCFNGNWELAMIEGLSSIAVFTENSTLFDHAMAMWRARVPAYFYIGSDGPQPRSVASCGAKLPYWYNQVVFNASVNGVCQETCRDFGHLGYGLASTFNVAETARIQGVDLYGEQRDRLTAALEFHTTRLNAGGYPPAHSPYKPSARNVTDPLVCNGANLKLSYPPTYQVGLTGISRLGQAPLPQTTKYVQDWVWTLSYNDACSPFMYCYEALTHGAAPKVTV